MKVTELMIGDLVVHIPTKKNVRIIGINPDGTIGVTAPLDDGSKFWWVFADSLEHIPLTPEILEKNGWNTPLSGGGFSSQIEIHGGDTCVTIDAIRHCLDIRLDDINYDMPTPRYVHELQHSLRLCGLEKLADNFQI